MWAPAVLLAAVTAMALGGAAAAPAAAQAVCREDALGYVACAAPVVPPPRPRPVFRDRAPLPWAGGDVQPKAPEIISGRRSRLGVTLRPGFEGPSGSRCREDRLGNLRCP